MDLAALDPAQPQAFYLSDPSLEALSDCFAVINHSARLPLHSHILAQHSTVLRELFLAQREGPSGGAAGGGGGGEHHDRSAAFIGSSVEEAAVLLRLLYAPRDASPDTFATLGERLPALAALAHKLDAPSLLAVLQDYLGGLCNDEGAGVSQLLDGLRTAQRCCCENLEDKLLASAAAALATSALADADLPALAALDSLTLRRLVCQQSQLVQTRGGLPSSLVVRGDLPPSLMEVRRASLSQGGGFTCAFDDFSRQPSICCSPWVEVGGLLWRAKVHTRGAGPATGSHLSVYLELACDTPSIASVVAHAPITVINQNEGRQDVSAAFAQPKTCDPNSSSGSGWIWLIALSTLRDVSCGYLKGDRLLLRADITVQSIQRSPAAA